MEKMEPSNGQIHTEWHREQAELDQPVVKEVEEPELDTLVDEDEEIILAKTEEEEEEEEENVRVNDEKEELSETEPKAESAAARDAVSNEFEEKGLGETRPDLVDVLQPPPSYEEAVTLLSSSGDIEALPGAEETEGDTSAAVAEEYYGDHVVEELDSVNVVGSSDSVPDQSTVATTPIISLSQWTVRPSSWRSCCGLFDVLRSSNR